MLLTPEGSNVGVANVQVQKINLLAQYRLLVTTDERIYIAKYKQRTVKKNENYSDCNLMNNTEYKEVIHYIKERKGGKGDTNFSTNKLVFIHKYFPNIYSCAAYRHQWVQKYQILLNSISIHFGLR